MRLYYFTSLDFGLLAIRNRRLKLARIDELNDPFEFLGFELKTKADRNLMNNWKREMSRRFALLCFSGNWQHPMLWGHYADKHKGICLGFDVPDKAAFYKVKYHSQRKPWPTNEHGERLDLNQEHMKELIYSKFDGWCYEDEWRTVVRLKEADPKTPLDFHSFGDHLKLAEVIVGTRAALTPERLKEALGDEFARLPIRQARSAFKTFTVVPDKRGWGKPQSTSALGSLYSSGLHFSPPRPHSRRTP